MLKSAHRDTVYNILKIFPDDAPIFHLGTAFLFCVLFNLYSYFYSPVNDPVLAAATMVFGFVQVLLFLFVIGLNRYVFSIALPILFLICSIATYYLFTFRIGISENIVAVTYETTIDEASHLMGAELFLWIAAHLALSLLIVFFYNKKRAFGFKGIQSLAFGLCAVLVMTTLLLTFPSKKLTRSLVKRDLPLSIAVSNYRYYKSVRSLKQPREDISKKYDFQYTDQGLLVVVILGESARADHFHINGYRRQTTPLLETLDVVNFPNVVSISAFTRNSVPCMLTRATRDNLDVSRKETSLISVFKRNGFYTAWISNQRYTSERHDTPITMIAKEAEFSYFNNQLRADEGGYFRVDEELLPHLDRALATGNRNKLVILHTIGSHWLYDAHYTKAFKKFSPVATNNNPALNPRERLINSYDNSILYTDYFISEVIQRVKGRNALVVYVGDHGELLGEDNLYEHPNYPFRMELYHVPFIVFASPEYRRRNGVRYAALRSNTGRSLSHENLFHSILDGAGISSSAIDKNKSIFSN